MPDRGMLLSHVNPFRRPTTETLINKVMHRHNSGNVELSRAPVVAGVKNPCAGWQPAMPKTLANSGASALGKLRPGQIRQILNHRQIQGEPGRNTTRNNLSQQLTEVHRDATMALQRENDAIEGNKRRGRVFRHGMQRCRVILPETENSQRIREAPIKITAIIKPLPNMALLKIRNPSRKKMNGNSPQA